MVGMGVTSELPHSHVQWLMLAVSRTPTHNSPGLDFLTAWWLSSQSECPKRLRVNRTAFYNLAWKVTWHDPYHSHKPTQIQEERTRTPFLMESLMITMQERLVRWETLLLLFWENINITCQRFMTIQHVAAIKLSFPDNYTTTLPFCFSWFNMGFCHFLVTTLQQYVTGLL